MSRYDVPSPLCRHKAAGTLGYPAGTEPFSPDQPHASTHVCAREACQEDAREWVWAVCRRVGVFTTFEQNRAARLAREGVAS